MWQEKQIWLCKLLYGRGNIEDPNKKLHVNLYVDWVRIHIPILLSTEHRGRGCIGQDHTS